ncbi:hypothetical protein PI124_g16089 [Phytophthora idaei]|nr:hypothetical protein PI125_g17885 [Phytophthora idaei]KAG3138976.1 hypothetical protein PI126_g16669 [Phytophthora idaei]KAG3238962.1 hypothetical protein PI124_g16089 [Phytophthora idaei]
MSMDEALSETGHDLTMVEAPPVSGAQEMVEPSTSPPSPELTLRLDDLSQDGARDDQVRTNEGDEEQKSNDEEESPLQRQVLAQGQIDRDAKRMEARLQRNLKHQQAHYARQRKLFENLRAESSPSSRGSDSPQSSDDPLVRQRASSPRQLVKAKFRFQKEELVRIDSLSRQRTHLTSEGHRHRHSSLPSDDTNDDDDDDSHAQNMLRRIKEKARAEFHRNRLSTGESSTAEIGTVAHSKTPTAFVEEMQQQEASNDALRRQLELLRRLQLENNRFRQEARSLRERNEVLKERDEVREREVKRLRDEVSELDAKVQRDHVSLAAAAQTTHKLKVTQKKLTAAQAEIRDLQVALQEARDTRDQLQSESQLEISDLVLEVKRWKRNSKQLRQQEHRSGEEIEFYKKTITALEGEVAERRSKLKDAKREIAQLAATIEEKTAQCESVETSAADCVKQMEEGMEALQKTHTHEREKRKKVETVRSNLQMQMERMQAENALLLDKKRELEQQLALFQEHWKERKQAYQDQLQRFAAQLEEHVSKHKSDAATIGSLREEYEALENRLGEVEAAAIELKSEVAEEAHTAQKQAEALRKYVERALHGTSEADDASLEAQVDSGQSCSVPELQVVQAAISALRNETMNIVHEFQRARHLVRQRGSKLTLAVEHVTELEHLRAEDAAKMKELREQRKLAEQAREIVSKEKMEVLKWSEQNCEKIESLEAELKNCGQLVLRVRKELHDALEMEESWDKPESVSGEPLPRSFSALEKEIDALVSMRDHWRTESGKQSQEVKEAQLQVQSLENEIAAKTGEFKKTLEEVDRVHSKNAQEQKLHFEQCIADVDSERMVLETKLREESAKLAQEEENSAKLQQVVDGFEEDVPVFATILHLFVLVVQPLILQVGDLLAQKRYLTRENAEFAQAHDQIECIGQVLKEMIPAAAQNEEKTKERQRRRVFRRVVIAVFAMNRFQHFANSATDADHQSAYGLSAPLKVVKSRKRTSALSSQSTVIKVLPPQQTLSRLSLRPLLERLKKMEITEKVAQVMESKSTLPGHLPSSLGNLILKVVMAVNPASKELLVANTNGTFHCQALLERWRRSNKKRSDQHDDMLAEYESSPSFEEDIPTVALIRKRILALGKRVEDLHYQRNSLQKENYEFQFQLDQQANCLKDMEVLQKKTQDLQDEMAALRSQTDQELQSAQQEHEAKGLEMQSKEDELAEAQAKIETLQNEILDAENRIERVELEKVSLRRELDRLKSSSIEEKEKADKSKSAARRQEEEVRSLKQAVKKAHDLYQNVCWQLEQEVQEKATLQTVVNHLRHQQEKAERELREEKIRELEKSFNDTESDGDDVEESYTKARVLRKSCETRTRGAKSASPTMKSKKKASFAPTIDINGLNKCDESLTKATSRRRKCENSDVSRQNEGVSPSSPSSSSVSPVPPRVHSKKSRSLEEVDNFLTEWQQLSVSRALMDIPHSGKGDRVRSEASDLCKVSPTKFSGLPKNVSWEKTTMEKSRRRREIDKVNAAVHDYMDRIDDKLSKMYGIPPSSAIQRSTTHHDITRDSDMEWETSLKTDEVRVQQYHSDVGSNDE